MVYLRRLDPFLWLPAVILLIAGTVVVSSVAPTLLGKHLIYLGLALLVGLLFVYVDLEILFPLAPLTYLLGLVGLIAPFLLGTVTRGSIRWISLAGVSVQPSEIIKPFLALLAGWYWLRNRFSWLKLFGYWLIFTPAVLLVFRAPDLGSSLVILMIVLGSLLVSGINFRQGVGLGILVLLVTPLIWSSLHDYQKQRLTHFLAPQEDPLGRGYNRIQAQIAIGSGMFVGRGVGRGTQSHLAFLPERHTDFVFASLAEEVGFLGSASLLLVYLFLFLRVMKIAGTVKNQGYLVLVLGLLAGLVFQTLVNLGMNVGLLPIVGITLPFVSYGGSSLLASMISLGLINNIARRSNEFEALRIK